MSASKVLDMAERQGLLDAKVISELRKQVAESKFVVTPEAVAKILVDKGQLTAFQARRLVASALEEPDAAAPPAPVPPPAAEKPAKRPAESEELFLADAPPPPAACRPLPPRLFRGPPPPRPPLPGPPSLVQPRKIPRQRLPKLRLPIPGRKSKNRPEPGPTVEMGSLTPLGAGLTPLGEVDGLSPLSAKAPQAWKGAPLAATDLLSPLGAADGLTPLDPLAEQKSAPRPAKKVKKGNSYSLIFILVTMLGFCLVVFVPLAFWFLYGNTAELFKQAEVEYDNGAMASAMGLYDKFLESEPTGPEASRARVRRNMAELRIAAGEGKNPRPGLTSAQKLLPVMEQEEQFDIIRVELRSLLVDIAHSFATQAHGVKETAKKEELAGLTDDAIKLVENPSYLPATLKAEVMPRINEVHDRLKAARRGIDQDKELAKSLAAIQKSIESGDAVGAYKVRIDLLKAFPAVEADAALAEATRGIGQMEQKNVKVEQTSLAASKEDPAPPDTRVLLVNRAGEAPLEGSAVLLVEGALFGLDAKNGKVNWRRFVGYETLIHPIPLSRDKDADVIAVDARKQELYRLSSRTGKLVWKLAIGKPFSPPVLGGEKIYVTTSEGRILEIDAATGNSAQQAVLPQKPATSLASDSTRGKLYQAGDHSTLFVLEGDTLECTQTVHLGHRAGTIAVAPVALLDHVLVVENPTDDFAVVHMLAPKGAARALERLPEPLRLKGRVVTPMVVDRNRIVIVTDLGQITVLQVDPSNKARPIRQVGGSEAIEKTPVLSFIAVDKGMIYAAGRRLSAYEIQGAQQKLGRKWTVATGDSFVGPPLALEDGVIHARKRQGSLATTVEATSSGNSNLWSVDLAAPLAALFPSEARQQVVAVTSRGRAFELSAEALAAGYSETPSFVPLAGTEAMCLTDGINLGGDKWACLGMKYSGHYLTYDNSAAGNRTKHFEARIPASEAASPAVSFRGGAVSPFVSGEVKLLNVDSAGDLALPFQPALQASQRLNWRQPAAISADVLAISDGANTIYRLTVENEPQPHLESLGETVVDYDVVSPLAVAGDTLYAVGRSSTVDTLFTFQGPTLQAGPKKPLQGRVQFGPTASGGAVFVADDKTLYCCESAGKIRWSIPLAHGAPTALVPHEQDFVVLTRTGAVYRVSQENGEEVGLVEVGEPLVAPASLFNGRLLASGPDGTIHLIPLPSKP